MSERLPARLLVAALVRRANASGGSAAVLGRGDPDGGTLALVLREAGVLVGLCETWTDFDGRLKLRSVPVAIDETGVDAWVAKRRGFDPDLWVIDLDVADAERFAAETIAVD